MPEKGKKPIIKKKIDGEWVEIVFLYESDDLVVFRREPETYVPTLEESKELLHQHNQQHIDHVKSYGTDLEPIQQDIEIQGVYVENVLDETTESYQVGESWKEGMGSKSKTVKVVRITYHEPQHAGDTHYVDVTFINRPTLRIFNPYNVTFKES